MHPKPLVGRAAQAALIDGAIESSQQGRGTVVFLTGRPGLGKTRLVEFATERARAAGLEVAIGRCWESGGAPVGWPWIEALRPFLSTEALRSAYEALPGTQPYLASMYPQLVDTTHRISSVADPTERFVVLDAVATLWLELARRSPLILVLEDLHAADEHSVELLAMLCERVASVPLLVIGTYRSREARALDHLRGPLQRAARRAHVEELSALSEEAAHELARQVLQPNSAPTDVAQIVARGDGNPLFLTELARAAGARHTPHRGPLTGIDHAIVSHIGMLDPVPRSVAELAAVLGRDVDPGALRPMCRSVSGLGDDEVERALEALNRLEIVETDAAGRTSFVHILVRDALYHGMDRARRQAGHAAALQALEANGAPASALTHHALESDVGIERTLALVRRAAAEATSARAFLDAAALLERGVRHAERDGTLDETSLAELRLEYAQAAILSGRIEEGRNACLTVADLAERSGDAELLARAGLTYGLEYVLARRNDEMSSLLRRGLDALGPEPSLLRARVLARYASAMYPHPDAELPPRLATEAIDLARRLGDERTLFEVLVSSRLPVYFWDPSVDVVARERELVELARRSDSLPRRATAMLGASVCLLMANAVHEAEARLAETLALAGATPVPQTAYRLHLVEAMFAGRRGDFEAAERSAARAEASKERGPVDVPIPLMTIHRVGQLRLLRDMDGLRAIHEELETHIAPMPSGPYFMSWYYATVGDLAAAREMYARCNKEPRGFAAMMVANLGDVAIALDDEPTCASAYEYLLPRAGQLLTSGMMGFTVEGSVHAVLGRLAAKLGRRAEADEHFRQAARVDADNGGRPALANTLEDWARWLLTGEADERARGRSVAAQAATELAAMGLEARASQMRALAGPPLAAPATMPAPSAIATLQLRRDGDGYVVTFGSTSFRVRASKGLRYLEQLVECPGREIHSVELMTADVGPEARASLGGEAGPLLDEKAKAAYRTRLLDLQQTLAEAEDHGDFARAEKAQHEMDALLTELGRATGLGGRDRDRSPAERARVNVQRRLKAAAQTLGEHCPALASHLQRALRTGAFCRYDPPANA